MFLNLKWWWSLITAGVSGAFPWQLSQRGVTLFILLFHPAVLWFLLHVESSGQLTVYLSNWTSNNELRNNPNVIHQVERLISSVKLFVHLHGFFEKGGNVIWTLADSVFVCLQPFCPPRSPLFTATGSASHCSDFIQMLFIWTGERRRVRNFLRN